MADISSMISPSSETQADSNMAQPFTTEYKTQIEKFASNMDDFITFIISLFNDCERNGCTIVPNFLLSVGVKQVKSYGTRELVEYFATCSHEHWDSMHNKEEKYFDENMDSVFKGLQMSNVNAFKLLLEAKDKNGELIVIGDDRNNIWEYLHAFVRIIIVFIHQERQPIVLEYVDSNDNLIMVNGRKKVKPAYRKAYLEEINLSYHAKKWGIKRRFSTRIKYQC